MEKQKKEEKNILKRLLNKLLSSKPILYTKKRDPSEIAKDIQKARKGNQMKNYKDAVEEGYRYFNKKRPEQKETRKPLPSPSQMDPSKWHE